ncbi:MAG: carboxypeptidase regulatory-like domain-containing protein [Armatimonadetes bacterium]|nr:carboxypeptidase regulatory-like domain-containing protein [Armatimonadota bacterium]
MTRRAFVVAFAGAHLAMAGIGWAATLSGQVTADGAPLPNAWVQLNTGQIAVSDARGRYTFPQVSPATYALQVLAPGKEPVVLAEVVPGRGRADASLAPAAVPRGLVHVKATTPDGAPCPTRIVTRRRAAEGEEWQPPEDLRLASTLDGRGRPLVPAEDEQASIVPFGACLWTRGEAVLALPPGQAELTCTSGVLRRIDQQVVEVKPNEVTEVAVSMMLGSELGVAGWTGGGLGWGAGVGGTYLTNIPLAATVCRAEGYDWVSLEGPHGEDPAQSNPRQAAAEASDERFAVWLAPELPPGPSADRLTVLGQEQPLPSGAPSYHVAGLLKRGTIVHADPLAPESLRELVFGLLADPAASLLLNVDPASARRDEHVRLWTSLLEWGGRMSCAAVSEGGLSQGRLPAPERTFAQTNGSLDQTTVVDALRRGATFATCGPVLGLTIGGVGPAETLTADDTTQVAEVDAALVGPPGAALTRLELVRSGRVARAWNVADVGPNHLQARLAIREREPVWYSLRAFGADGLQAAHTSPIHFVDPAQPPAPVRQARFTGTVVDAATGRPVSGAKVTATTPGERPLSVDADPAGRYAVTAPLTAALEASHPRYVGEPSVKFAVWDCPSIREALGTATPDNLSDPEFCARVEEALAAPVIDFRLTPR